MQAMNMKDESNPTQIPARRPVPLSRMHMPFDASAIAMQVGWTPLLRAYFGRAKTAMINDIARKLGKRVFCLVGSMTDPLDLKGLPFIENGEVHYAPEAMIKVAQETNGEVVIFLDELTTFPSAVRAVTLKMIHERICGPHQLPQATMFAAACNAAKDAPNGRPLDAGNINRMVVIDMPPMTRDDVSRWASANVIGFNQAQMPDWTIVPKDWRATHRGAVAALIDAWADVGDNWKAWDERATSNDSGDFMPYGSLRSWEMVTDMIAAASAAGVAYEDERMVLLVKGCVGGPNAASLLTEMKVLAVVPTAQQMLSGERDLPSGMFETRLAAMRLYDHAGKHPAEPISRAVTQMILTAAERTGAGVCRKPLGMMYRLLMDRKLNKKDYAEALASVISSNRIRLGSE